jgi:hypothetical protein
MYSALVAFCVITVPMMERIASRMRREMVSLSERKRSKRIRINPFSFSLSITFDSFILFFDQFEIEKLLPQQAGLPALYQCGSGPTESRRLACVGREVIEIFNIN